MEIRLAVARWPGPLRPYAELLISAIPSTKAVRRRVRLRLGGDLCFPLDLPAGCRFRTCCPMAIPVCRAKTPPMRRFIPGYLAACRHVGSPTILSVSEVH
ncbi:MAG: oligopeptide/dipeptide ABC transporter ATP-binding protein [Janthinobacterium lividum]